VPLRPPAIRKEKGIYFMKRLRLIAWLHRSLLFLGVAFTVNATQILTNGSFESGLTGWTVTNSTTDGSSWFVTNQPRTPINGYPTPGPSNGSYYAVTDDVGPGLHAITQTFTDPLGTTSAIISFDVFMNDVYGLGGNPQISCVCLIPGGADPLTATPIQILYGPFDLFQSNPATTNPYVHVSEDISSFMAPGQTYQLRVLVKNSNPYDVGVDNFSLNVTTSPEPSTFVPLVLLTAFLAYRSRTYVHPKI
jgi:hypothetical protein